MVSVMWRASAPEFEVDSFLLRFDRLKPDAVWRRGEKHQLGSLNDTSGFNKTLVDTDITREAVSKARQALDRWQPALAELRLASVGSVIDFGLIVDERFGLPHTLHFTSADLEWLQRLGLELTVSMYPSSEAA